jgi:hypothetical protein
MEIQIQEGGSGGAFHQFSPAIQTNSGAKLGCFNSQQCCSVTEQLCLAAEQYCSVTDQCCSVTKQTNSLTKQCCLATKQTNLVM